MPAKDKKKLMGVGLGAGLLGALVFALKYALKPAKKAPLPDSISPAVFATKVMHTSLGHVIYHEAGEGEPLLFLHSVCLGGSSYEWSKVYPEFVRRYRVLAPDLVGFGESQRPNVQSSANDYVRMLAEFIRATCWEEKPVIVASGLTAGFCLQLASQHPDLLSRMVLYMPTGDYDFGFARLRLSTRMAARTQSLQRFLYKNYQSTRTAVRNWLASGGYANADRLTDEVVEVFTTCARQSGAEYAIRNLHAGKLNVDLEDRVALVSLPVTYLWGNEPSFPALEYGQWLQSRTRHSRFVVLPRVGALAALEDPAQMAEVLDAELDPGFRVVRD